MRVLGRFEALFPRQIDALLIAGGAMPQRRLLRAVRKRAGICIAVDGGLRHFRRLGIVPQLVIGDLDSAGALDLEWARQSGARIARLSGQDDSDIEKALTYCEKNRLHSLVVAGVDGDRPDHFLHAISRAIAFEALDARFLLSSSVGIPLRGRASVPLDLDAGTSLSWLGCPKALRCSLEGVKWPFANRTLELGGFQSLSNSVTGNSVRASQQSGKSLLLIPVK